MQSLHPEEVIDKELQGTENLLSKIQTLFKRRCRDTTGIRQET